MWNDLIYGQVSTAAGPGGDTLAIAALFLGPFSAIVVAAVTAFVSRKNGKGTTTVAHKEASTHEFSALTEGFVHQLTFFQQELDTTRARVNALSDRVTTLEAEKSLLIEHIRDLEDMVLHLPDHPPDRLHCGKPIKEIQIYEH